jgi:hypothetical protein
MSTLQTDQVHRGQANGSPITLRPRPQRSLLGDEAER